MKCSECGEKIDGGKEINTGKDERGHDYIVCSSCYGDIVGTQEKQKFGE